MTRRGLLSVATVAAGLLILVADGRWLDRQLAIDACLDAGGRWNGEAAACEGTRAGG